MLTINDKINQLYKNYAGTANTNRYKDFYIEQFPSINSILSENIFINSVPKENISTTLELYNNNNWKNSIDYNPSLDLSNASYADLYPNHNIQFYKNIQLDQIPNSNRFAWYKLDNSNNNILQDIIHFKHSFTSPIYAYIVSIGGVIHAMLTPPYKWTLDNKSGILQFYGDKPNENDIINITFYKYNGIKGINNLQISGSIQDLSSITNINSDIQIISTLLENFSNNTLNELTYLNSIYSIQNQTIININTNLTNNINILTDIVSQQNDEIILLKTQLTDLSNVVTNLLNNS